MKDNPGKDIQEQFVRIIENNQGLIYKVAHAYCNDREELQDLVQEIIFQLWRSFKNYDQQYKISTWMYRIALNVAISHIRKSRVREKHHISLDLHLVHVAGEEKSVMSEMSEEIGLLRQFIHEQNKLDKALLLMYLDENSYAQIAEVLGISVSNVGTRLGRLKQKMKQYITINMQ